VLTANDTVNSNWTYSYDAFNRLTCSNLSSNGTCASPASGKPTFSYVYDRFGNRWQQNGPATFLATFSGNNNQMDSFSYDAAGNLLKDQASNAYSYDAENRIVSVNNGATTYAYNPKGQRVAKTTGGVTTDFIYDRDGHVILTNPDNPTFIEMYVAGMHLGTYDVNSTQTASIFYYDHADWLGTERARTNLSGVACETTTSYPFGDAQAVSSSCGQLVSPRRFTGKERDSESGLDYFGARYFTSSMGRWMSPDRLNVTDDRLEMPSNTLNKYVYGANNPFRFIDQDGKDIVALFEPPHGVRPGHFALFANNPQTGESALISFGPRDESTAGSVITALGGTQESTKMFNWPQSADDLRQNYAALSIQTTPEQAQEVINFIKNLDPSNINYKLFSQNCTTVCRDALKAIGLLPGNTRNITPVGLWENVFSRYARPLTGFQNWLYNNGYTPHNRGTDYGNPRFGVNTFDFLWLQTKPPRACTTIQGPNGPETHCEN
jgi:RHS repeat-associated protein